MGAVANKVISELGCMWPYSEHDVMVIDNDTGVYSKYDDTLSYQHNHSMFTKSCFIEIGCREFVSAGLHAIGGKQAAIGAENLLTKLYLAGFKLPD